MTIGRRDMMTGASAAGAALLSSPVAPRRKETKTYILVHGTWLGGWIWADVAERLRAKGHRVFTPTLTGCGERNHLIGPAIGLDTHIRDITAVMDFEGLSNVILVGHSFSGVAITGAADARRSALRRLVYFDALIPAGDRMSGLEYAADGSLPGWWQTRAAKFGGGYAMEFWADYPPAMLVPPTHPELEAVLRARVTTHPAKSWTDRLVLAGSGWDGLPRTCIRAMAQQFAPSSEKMWGPGRGPGWDLIELPVPRMGMMTHADIVAECLAGLG
jgi:pimeloyl-ACP methyl ester carboxylesterase